MSPRSPSRGAPGSTVELPVPPPAPVAIKGDSAGLRVVVTDGSDAGLEDAVREQVARRGESFFKGAAVNLELPGPPLDLALAQRLGAILAEAGIAVAAVTGRPSPKTRPAPREPLPEAVSTGPIIVSGPLRGGQRLSHSGAVVILGDVNPGAEVVAGGSVLVWGRLRGQVEAGRDPTFPEPIVGALDLAPTQLRIGTAVARAPEEPARSLTPEVATVEEGRIVVKEWR